MQRRLQRGIALALGTQWPSYRGLLALFFILRLLLSVGLHLSATLASTFTMENMRVPYGDTVTVFMVHTCVGFVANLLASAPIDRLPSFLIILAACLVGGLLRLLLAWPGTGAWLHREGQLVLICAVLPVNDALFRSTVLVALKRILAVEYAGNPALEKSRRKLFVAIFYALHNVGDIVANVIYYRWRKGSGGPVAANKEVLYLSVATLGLAAACVLWMRRVGPRADRARVPLTKPPPYLDVLRQRGFWRYFGVVLALAGVVSMFLHFELTLTKHMLIESGPTSSFPLLQSINPAMIIVLAPLSQWLSDQWELDTYNVLVAGASVSAIGCLLIGLLQAVPQIPLVVAYGVGLVVFSFGEAAWSPRILSDALEVAPEGSEAVYQALSTFPNLLAMLIGPVVSHALVDAYCTATHCNGAVMWSILGLVAASSPVLLTLGRRWLKE